MAQKPRRRVKVRPAALEALPACDKDSDREAAHISASLARIEDPLIRYLIGMLLDRLTEQIAQLLQNQGRSVPSGKDSRAKVN